MKTVLLTGDNLTRFLNMDPFDQAEVLGLEGSFALGITADTDGMDDPAGILIACAEDDRLVIRWIYVLPKYRGNGYGSELMYFAFEEAKRRGLSEVSARINERFEDAGLYWDLDSFFINDVFKDYEDGLPELWLSVKSISKVLARDEKINEKAAHDRTIVPLSKLSKLDLADIKVQMKESIDMVSNISPDEILKAADPDMSFVKMSDKGYCGGIFIRKTGFKWFVYLLSGRDSAEEEALARCALYNSEDYTKSGELICAALTKKANLKLMQKLDLPYESYDVHYITAYISDYIAQTKLVDSKL